MVIFIFYFENILYSIQTLHVNFWFVCLIYINDFILSRKTIWSIGYNAFPPVIEEMHGSHKRCDPTSWWGVLTVMHNRWCLYTCVGRMVRCWWGVGEVFLSPYVTIKFWTGSKLFGDANFVGDERLGHQDSDTCKCDAWGCIYYDWWCLVMCRRSHHRHASPCITSQWRRGIRQ